MDRQIRNSYDIEHVWAEDYTQDNHQYEFSTEEEFQNFRNSFGGLLLLPKDKNRSFQAMNYHHKLIKYDSENLLARSLNPNCYKNNPSFLRFISSNHLTFKSHNTFDKSDMEEYKHVSRKIWDISLLSQF